MTDWPPPEPPDGSILEFEWGTDLYAIHRDDEASRRAGWSSGDGGETWTDYGSSVPCTWATMCERYYRTGMNDGLDHAVRLIRHPDDLPKRQQWPTALWGRDEEPEYRPDEDQHAEAHAREMAELAKASPLPDDDVRVLTPQEWEKLVQRNLDDLGVDYDELRDMAADDDFPTFEHKKVWLLIGGTR